MFFFFFSEWRACINRVAVSFLLFGDGRLNVTYPGLYIGRASGRYDIRVNLFFVLEFDCCFDEATISNMECIGLA